MSQNSRLEPRRVRPGRANEWMRDAWGQFKRAPLDWAVVLLGCLLLYVILSFVPAGPILSAIVQPLLVGAIMLGCHAGSQEARGFRIQAMKQAFDSPRITALLQLGLLGLLLNILAVIPLGLMLAYLLQSTADLQPSGLAPLTVLGLGLLLLPVFLVLMAMWFAPALVAVEGYRPVAALRDSVLACWRNPLALLLLGLWLLLLFVLVALTFGLALVVAVPLVFASQFASFEDVFDLRRQQPNKTAGVLEA